MEVTNHLHNHLLTTSNAVRASAYKCYKANYKGPNFNVLQSWRPGRRALNTKKTASTAARTSMT
eukprot:1232031-Lingulodinium_polyedra.AAC.1